MSAFLLNMISAGLLAAAASLFALSLLWRIGAWRTRPIESLMEDEGLPIGSKAKELAAHSGRWGSEEAHLSFFHVPTFLVFGAVGCRPCPGLVEAAARHLALRGWRLVYVAGSKDVAITDLEDLPAPVLDRWEFYRFHDEQSARTMWRAPVSPYYHAISTSGRILAKGVANKSDHLDHLLTLVPSRVAS